MYNFLGMIGTKAQFVNLLYLMIGIPTAMFVGCWFCDRFGK